MPPLSSEMVFGYLITPADTWISPPPVWSLKLVRVLGLSRLNSSRALP